MRTHTHITVVCLYIPSLKPNSLRMNIYSLQSIKGFAFHIDIHVDSNLKKKNHSVKFFLLWTLYLPSSKERMQKYMCK